MNNYMARGTNREDINARARNPAVRKATDKRNRERKRTAKGKKKKKEEVATQLETRRSYLWLLKGRLAKRNKANKGKTCERTGCPVPVHFIRTQHACRS